jgi:hypothetical protein
MKDSALYLDADVDLLSDELPEVNSLFRFSRSSAATFDVPGTCVDPSSSSLLLAFSVWMCVLSVRA